MKKLIFLAALAFAASSHADYLHWQVGLDDGSNLGSFTKLSEANHTYAAKVVAVKSDGGVETKTTLTGAGLLENSFAQVESSSTYWSLSLDSLGSSYSDYASYSFYVELYWVNYADTANLDMQCVGVTAYKSYADLYAAGAVTRPLSAIESYYVASPYMIPEPSSSLLVILGAALAALRRRRLC